MEPEGTLVLPRIRLRAVDMSGATACVGSCTDTAVSACEGAEARNLVVSCVGTGAELSVDASCVSTGAEPSVDAGACAGVKTSVAADA